MNVEAGKASGEQWELCLRLMAPSGGSFSPVSFLMTSSFRYYDFQVVSEAATRGSSEKGLEEILRKEFAASKDKQQFLFEHSIAAHEKRHFVDFVSTPFGLHVFRTNWALCASFLNLLSCLAEREQPVKIPLRHWATSNDCPKAVRKFLDDYKFRDKEMRRLIFAGEPTQVPASAVPQRYSVVLTRVEVEDTYKPYVGFLDGEEYKFYPINGFTVLEGLAWIVQYIAMARIDESVADMWWRKLIEIRQLWMYWALPRLLMDFIGLDAGQSLKVLEGALMIPVGIAGDEQPGDDPDEFDPAWRLYWLSKHLMEERAATQDIEQAVEEVSMGHGWKTVEEVIKQTQQYIARRFSNVKLDPNDPLSSVIYEYVGLMRQSLDAREGSPLMGFEYMKKLPTLPPMTRKVLPDGSMQIRMKKAETENDEIAVRSWVMFAVLSSAISECVDADRLVCPFAVRNPVAIFPGCGECTCELRMDECYLSTVMKMVGASFC